MTESADDQQQPDWAVFSDTQGTDWFATDQQQRPVGGHNNEEISEETNDFEEWQEFSSIKDLSNDVNTETRKMGVSRNNSDISISNSVKQVIKTCFPLPDETSTQSSTQLRDLDNQRCISDLRTTTVSLTNFDWSRCFIKDQYFLAMLALEQDNEEVDKGNIDLSGFDNFEWNEPDSLDGLVRQDSTTSADSSGGGVRFSPQDKFQEMFRSTTGRAVDSPIEIEFDHSKAVLGLSMLPSSDLITMKNEMSGKITKLSNELVSVLQTRDVLLLETVTKNRFIQAMLKVQESKMAAVQQSNDSLSISLEDVSLREDGQPVVNGGGVVPGPGDELRPQKRRSRSRSLQNLSRSLLAKAKSLRTVEEEKSSNEMLLRVVIPYRQDTGTIGTGWNVPVLKQWTKILQAMADKNPNVSNLISDYLTSVIDSIPNGPDSSSNGPHSDTSDPCSNTNGPHSGTSFQQFQVSD